MSTYEEEACLPCGCCNFELKQNSTTIWIVNVQVESNCLLTKPQRIPSTLQTIWCSKASVGIGRGINKQPAERWCHFTRPLPSECGVQTNYCYVRDIALKVIRSKKWKNLKCTKKIILSQYHSLNLSKTIIFLHNNIAAMYLHKSEIHRYRQVLKKLRFKSSWIYHMT